MVYMIGVCVFVCFVAPWSDSYSHIARSWWRSSQAVIEAGQFYL